MGRQRRAAHGVTVGTLAAVTVGSGRSALLTDGASAHDQLVTSDRLGMMVLPTHECLALLRSVEVGRLAANGDFPEILPVNFVVADGTVMFRTAPGSKLAALTNDQRVAFEADGYDAAAGEAWSVVVKGLADVLRHPHQVLEAADLPLFPWQTAPKHHFVRIEPVEITGRRFHVIATRPATLEAPPRRSAGE
jgi:nitroimidazol reductase NimA-like FMN-containing flavoprotein (pyridoxamine 5'-phosphate oxidase superfamily)